MSLPPQRTRWRWATGFEPLAKWNWKPPSTSATKTGAIAAGNERPPVVGWNRFSLISRLLGTTAAVGSYLAGMARAIADLFGDHARRLLVSSTKAAHGHAMGASGALETVATVLALAHGRVPPTANLVEADPDLPALDFVPDSGRRADVEVALKNSFAFGGNNAVLVLRRPA